jgi:hypothetical protein
MERRAAPLLAEAAALSDRVDSLERALSDGKAEILEVAEQAAARTRQTSRFWRGLVAVLAVALASAGSFAWWYEHQASEAAARTSEIERQSRMAEASANQRIAETRDAAAQEVAQARESALKAETISNVLAAPDLIRFNLAGGDGGSRYSAQALFSRSRGFVLSGSRLPSLAANTIYQIWLLTNTDPVSVGVFAPDSLGRATIATDTPPKVPRPVLGISVTLEPAGGREQPTGATILARAGQPVSSRP